MMTTRASGMREWSFTESVASANPFVDRVVRARVTAPSGAVREFDGFYAGDGVWRVRFTPDEPGEWAITVRSTPADAGLELDDRFVVDVVPSGRRLVARPELPWSFALAGFDDPYLLVGDTVYHLFGMAHCGIDVRPFLERRKSQGFNVMRVRVPVSPFHPPAGHSVWQTRSCWPWGGSEQSPRFDQFDLGYFETVDRVLGILDELGMHAELIMEAWAFEFPFANRDIFTAEWEELWLRYLVARLDAFESVGVWTPANEYEFYPDGHPVHSELADRWLIRVARLVRSLSAHGRPIAVHNAPPRPAFAHRFRTAPDAIDIVMLQAWGSHDAERGDLADGIEQTAADALAGWTGSAVLAEYGYEMAPDLPRAFALHDHCSPAHTRRGAWRGLSVGLAVITGFEYSWGPFAVLDRDQVGMRDFLVFVRVATAATARGVRPSSLDALGATAASGEPPPAVLASPDGAAGLLYFAQPGAVRISVPEGARWISPEDGSVVSPAAAVDGELRSPGDGDGDALLVWGIDVTEDAR